ncbi:MAG: AAA family ATPase [Kiritimatiellae bacterium]|nr:AAA family ATPase [Kiritimatiellia bacterium]
MQDNDNAAAVQPRNNAQTTGISVPGDKAMAAVRGLEASGQITGAQADDILWFYNFVQAKSLSLENAGRAVGMSGTTVYRLFTASYQASYDAVLEKVAKFRALTEERQKRKALGFVETSTWKKVEAVCRQALNDQMPAFIYGPSQMGKTTCLLEFARRNNHGTTRYIRMPAAPSFSFFVKTVAAACGISPHHNSADELRERVCHALDSRNLLIVDEFHQAMVTVTDRRAATIMEFIREIYDRTGCGIVLCATDVGRREVEEGRNAGTYGQLRKRGMIKLVLPDMPPASDIRKIAAAFGLPAPEGRVAESIRQMLKASGLGMYVKYLQSAHVLAAGRGEKPTWDTFAAVCDGMAALANP